MNMLILAIFNGFLGYSLPDDLVSGTGIRISYSILETIPLVGTYLANFLFGGSFPGTSLIPRFYVIHVLILPAIIAGLLGAHLTLLVRQKHTQFKGHGATEHNVVEAPMWPTFVAKTNGFLLLEGGYSAVPSASCAGDAAPELEPVALDTSIVLPALVGSPSYEGVDRSGFGARAAAGDGIEAGNGSAVTTDRNGAEPTRRGVFRIPRNYR